MLSTVASKKKVSRILPIPSISKVFTLSSTLSPNTGLIQ